MRRLLIPLLLVTVAIFAQERRRVTPVNPAGPVASPTRPTALPDSVSGPDMSRMAHYHDEEGNMILVDTVTGTEWVDSANFKVVGNVYPLLHAVTVGVDIWDPVMRVMGQKFGGASVWGEISFHNRFNPVFEFGLGVADDTPSAMNFTYSSPLAPYFKIGGNYNFLYNSNPDYQLLGVFRYGFTTFDYRIKDVTLDNSYWGETETMSFPTRRSTAGYLEFGLGLKVKIVGPLSLGWTAKFHTIIHESKAPDGEPMVIPGYGKRNASLTGAFSIMYTIGLNKPAPAVVE